jgi:fructose-bisphosphate aldolase, class I
VVQCAFNGRRVVIFSGGVFHDEAAILEEVRAIHEGGGFGSVMGRNMFQRPKTDALRLLEQIMDIYASKRPRPVHPRKGNGRVLAAAGMSSHHDEV